MNFYRKNWGKISAGIMILGIAVLIYAHLKYNVNADCTYGATGCRTYTLWHRVDTAGNYLIVLGILHLVFAFIRSYKDNPARFKGTLRRLLIVAGILASIIVFVRITAYLTREHLQYTAAPVDCSKSAIEKRNKAEESKEDACIITLSVKNTGNKTLRSIDYDELGFGGSEGDIRIYDKNGKYCYAFFGYNGSGDGFLTLKPGETQSGPLSCRLDPRQLAIDDLGVDSRPAYVVVNHEFNKVRVDLRIR